MKTLSDKSILSIIGPDAKRSIELNYVRLNINNSVKKMYSKKNPKQKLWFHEGFDLLQYLIIVKPYIIRKYKLDNETELDILLYLFPIQYFSADDFNVLPVRKASYNCKLLKEKGLLSIAVKGFRGPTIYKLSEKSIKAVKDFYGYLSGYKTLNKDVNNPFRSKDSSKMDKLRESLMLRLKHDHSKWRSRFNDDF